MFRHRDQQVSRGEQQECNEQPPQPGHGEPAQETTADDRAADRACRDQCCSDDVDVGVEQVRRRADHGGRDDRHE
jgi:hypothetical protein